MGAIQPQQKPDFSDAPWMELVEGYGSNNYGGYPYGYPLQYGYNPYYSYYQQQPQQPFVCGQQLNSQTYQQQAPIKQPEQVSYSQQNIDEEDNNEDELKAEKDFEKFIDNLNKVTGNSSIDNVEGLGKPRVGQEEFAKLGLRSDEELIYFHLNNILSVETEEFKGSDIKFGLESISNKFYQLNLFLNDRYIDSFLIDSGILFGKGIPAMQSYLISGYDMFGKPMLFPDPVWIPLGCYLAIRQNIFRKFPCGNGINMNGTDITVYSSAMYDMLTKDFYRLVDMSDTLMPDDNDTYKEFGKKVMMINNTTYQLKGRYRVHDYKSNDDFYLISDKITKQLPGEEPFITNTFIEVKGKNLYITEPSNKLSLVIKNRHFNR